MSEKTGSGRAEASRLPAVAALLAASVLLSRVSGYARDLVFADQVGAGPEADAYFMAFLLPDLLNYLLAGGALSIAFVPFYTRVLEQRGDAAAGRLFATVLGTLGAATLVATAALWWGADALAAAWLTKFDPSARALTVELARIVLPAQLFFVTGGILRAVLMAHGRFRTQAAAPLLYNVCVIAGGLATGTAEGFAWGVVVGAMLGGWLYPLLDLRQVRAVRLRVAFDADLRAYLFIAAPLMLGVSLTTVDEWYGKFLAAALSTGSVAHLSYARKLMMVPVAVVGQAIGAAALPALSGLFASGRDRELARTLERTLRAALAFGVLAGAAAFVLARPAVELLFHHGAFDEASAVEVSHLLAVMACAVPAWVVQQVAVRGFYAREDTWRPMLLGTGVALAAIPLYLWLRGLRGVSGLAEAGVIAMSANAALTVAWARARHGTPDLAALGVSALRALASAVPAAVAAALVVTGAPGNAAALRDLALGGAVFVGVSALGITLAGDAALRDPIRRLAARLGLRGAV